MLILKTAIKNILYSGKRMWLNVFALAITFGVVIFFNSINDGWREFALNESVVWNTSTGQLWSDQYDPYDIFTINDAHSTITPEIEQLIKKSDASPVLIQMASAFPEGKMMSVKMRGIPASQDIIKVPTKSMIGKDNESEIPVVIGERFKKMLKANIGDNITLRWKDKNGAFDSQDMLIVDVFKTDITDIDINTVWLDYDKLSSMLDMNNQASYILLKDGVICNGNSKEWIYKDFNALNETIITMIENDKKESYITISLFILVAMLCIFDTQILSIFKRQREIGTYIALGMTPNRVVKLFTLEGIILFFMSAIVLAVIGTPIFWYICENGFYIGEQSSDSGFITGNIVYPVIKWTSVMQTFLILLISTAFISFIACRRISKNDIVSFLKAKKN